MMIDPFTTPVEAEREARIQQARDRLDAATAHISVYSSNAASLNYVEGARAVRDALVGQGHAMLAIHAELADIAGSLRTLAALPGAVQEALSDLGNDVCEVHSAIGDGTAVVVDTGDSLTDAIRDLADVVDRPRWWKFWRSRQRPVQSDTEPA
ncbi:hypothetical protein ACIBEJ_34185 [Nonomuraea sp. NPDC050790]|uniref:hypothetical protein n=1 Tax=Nonomuraea sp. NPDC050790 TaxID=3364371 RepID=UPI0037BC4B9A